MPPGPLLTKAGRLLEERCAVVPNRRSALSNEVPDELFLAPADIPASPGREAGLELAIRVWQTIMQGGDVRSQPDVCRSIQIRR